MQCLLFVLTSLLTFSTLLLSSTTTALALSITIADEAAVTVPALVVWTREFDDPAVFTFDLRFVEQRKQPNSGQLVDFDVGLAKANIVMNNADTVGTTSVLFPNAGQFVLKAVSGPDNTVIAESNQVISVNLTATASPTPTPTSSTSATSATSQTSSSTSSASATATSAAKAANHNANPNIPAIVGGVVAGILVLALLIVLFVFLSRRRKAFKRRLTFHRDMMVQRRLSRNPPVSAPAMVQVIRPSDDPGLLAATKNTYGEDSQGSMPSPIVSTPFRESLSPPPSLPPIRHSNSTLSSEIDLEQGFGEMDMDSTIPRPQVTGLVVPPPRGPRGKGTTEWLRRPPGIHSASIVPTRTDSPPPTPTLTRTDAQGLTTTIITSRAPNTPTPLRTRRQKQILDRISMLKEQMAQLDGKRDSPSQNRLEDMKKEMMWLRDQENGSWAMGLTDVLPPGHVRYLTP